MNTLSSQNDHVLFEHQPFVGVNPPPPIFRVLKKESGIHFVEYNFDRGELHFEGEGETMEAALEKLLLTLKENDGFTKIHNSQYLWLRKQLASMNLLKEA